MKELRYENLAVKTASRMAVMACLLSLFLACSDGLPDEALYEVPDVPVKPATSIQDRDGIGLAWSMLSGVSHYEIYGSTLEDPRHIDAACCQALR